MLLNFSNAEYFRVQPTSQTDASATVKSHPGPIDYDAAIVQFLVGNIAELHSPVTNP